MRWIMEFLRKNGKGILLCFLIALACRLLVGAVGALEAVSYTHLKPFPAVSVYLSGKNFG